jgi:hypothetical protein
MQPGQPLCEIVEYVGELIVSPLSRNAAYFTRDGRERSLYPPYYVIADILTFLVRPVNGAMLAFAVLVCIVVCARR